MAADIFNVELTLLERLAAKGDNFRVFHIQQGEKTRQVEVPKAFLARIHRRLFALLERIEKPPYLHSGVKKRSYVSNARAHLGSSALIKLDLKRFYPSVRGYRIHDFFHRTLQCSPDVAGLLTRLCVYDGHVPTGSSLSQLLAFFAVKPLFDEIDSLAKSESLAFTVYVDDMTISGDGASPDLLWRVKQIVHAHGLTYHKDRYYPPGACCVVTGVLIDGSRLAVQPSKEFAMWQGMRALSGGHPTERNAALEQLIGRAVAASQIEARFLEKVRALRSLRKKAMSMSSAVTPA